MKKLVKIMLFVCFLSGSSNITAQSNYQTALGVRLGYSNGITLKHFVSTNDALEGILSTRWRGFQFTGLYERHFNAFSVPELRLFVGGGGHVGYFHSNYYRPYRFNRDHRYYDNYFGNIGIDGILGIEYTFSGAPINLSLDIKPSMDLLYLSPIYMGAGFSVRYTF